MNRIGRDTALAVAWLVLTGCSEPMLGAQVGNGETPTAERAQATSQITSTNTPQPDCFVTLAGWERDNQALFGGCRMPPWIAFVKSTDLPALFARYKLPGVPPLMNPTGYADNNTIEYRLTWLGAPGLPPRIRRWRAPRHVDCSRRLGTACYTEDIDPVLFEAGDYISGANRLWPYLKFYWDAERGALLAQFEPRDLYTYAAFYVGDVQVELRAYHGTQPYLPTLIDLARREMHYWTKEKVR